MKRQITIRFGLAILLLSSACNVWEFPDEQAIENEPDLTSSDMDEVTDTDDDMGAPGDMGECPRYEISTSTSLSANGEEVPLAGSARDLVASLAKDGNGVSLRLLWAQGDSPRSMIVPVELRPELLLGLPSPILPLDLSPQPNIRDFELASRALPGSSETLSQMLLLGDECEVSESHRLWIGSSSSAFDHRFVASCAPEKIVEGLAYAGGRNPYDGSSRGLRIFTYAAPITDPTNGELRFFDAVDSTLRKGFNDETNWSERARTFSTTGRRVFFADAQRGLVTWDIHQDADIEEEQLVPPQPFQTEIPPEMEVVHLRDENYVVARSVEAMDGSGEIRLERRSIVNNMVRDPATVGRISELPASPRISMTATFRGIAIATLLMDTFRLYHSSLPTPTSEVEEWNEFEPDESVVSEVALDAFHDECHTYVAVATIEGPDANLIDVEIFVVE